MINSKKKNRIFNTFFPIYTKSRKLVTTILAILLKAYKVVIALASFVLNASFRAEYREIKKSNLFDDKYYCNTRNWPEICCFCSLYHFIKYGWKQGQNPNSFFNTAFYLNQNSDVARLGINPLLHYILYGKKEGRLIQSPKKAESIHNFKEKLLNFINNSKKSLLLITHDFSRTGAPLLLLNIAKTLFKRNYNVIVLSISESGALLADFEEFCLVTCLYQSHYAFLENPDVIEYLFFNYFGCSISESIGNTIASGFFIPFLEKYNFNYQILIHEMPETIRLIQRNSHVCKLFTNMRLGRLVYSSHYVLQQHQKKYTLCDKVEIIPQGMFQIVTAHYDGESKKKLLEKYSLPAEAKIILHGGKSIDRKGLDLFITVAKKVSKTRPDIYFIFLGVKEEDAYQKILNNENNNPQLILGDFTKDYSAYLEGSDIYALTSREDPFPNVILDALAHGLPVIAFEKGGGAAELLSKIDNFLIVKDFDTKSFANKIIFLLDNTDKYQEFSKKAIEVIQRDYQFDIYVDKLCQFYTKI